MNLIGNCKIMAKCENDLKVLRRYVLLNALKFAKFFFCSGRGSGIVVSIVAYCSDDPSLIPADN